MRCLERAAFDSAMNGLEITPDRLARVRFSKPYYAYKLQLVVRQDEDRFTSLEGVRKVNGVVGTLEDTAAARLLDARRIKKRLYDGQVEPYMDLAQNQLDAVLLDWPIVEYYAKKSMVTPDPPKLKVVGRLIGRGYYAIAFDKKSEATARTVDEALDRLFAKGDLRRIYE